MFPFRRRAGRVVVRPDGSAGTYIFGRGRNEINRLDMQHYMFRIVFHGDFSAPISNRGAFLDVACGTGLWASQMAQRFPQANVFGFDKNTAQFINARLPRNCTLLAGDALDRFPFNNGDFDYVMARANSAYVPQDRWPQHLAEMVRVTKPGGWIEVRDFGVVESQSPSVTALTRLFVQLAERIGIYPGVGPYIEAMFKQIPFSVVRVQSRVVVARPHSLFDRSQGGELMIRDYLAVLERVTPLVDRLGLVNESDWRSMLQVALQEIQHYPSRVTLTSAIGRKL
jgi:ubiquinone/menaquinone biosynthesis C-methylase UbiE